MLYYTQSLVLSLFRLGSCGWLRHLWANLLLLWGLGGCLGRSCGSCSRLGSTRLLLSCRLLLLNVVLAQVVLQVQESQLDTLGHLQQALQLVVHVNLLTILQLLGLEVLVHVVRHLGTRDQSTLGQLQESAQSLCDLLGLVEAIVLGASLLLLTGGVLNKLTNLANLLANSLQLLHQLIESHGNIGSGGHSD